MALQSYLIDRFRNWQPSAPAVVNRTKSDIALSWMEDEPFGFLGDQLLYRVEKSNKMPSWVVVYSGGKTSKVIDNLPPRHPHKFRLKVILKTTAVPHLAETAIQYFGDEATVYEEMRKVRVHEDKTQEVKNMSIVRSDTGDTTKKIGKNNSKNINLNGDGDVNHDVKDKNVIKIQDKICADKKWLESSWSEETWTSTDTDGTSIVCFCMAVKCGYLKQLQVMLEERPELIGIINPTNGFTPLATAVRKGDINIVRFLLTAGADINQPSTTEQAPLHLAVLAANTPLVELLMEKGADMLARDCNGLRVEHYAVDSGNLEILKYILDRGGDITAEDNNGWTPLFRAVCQGAKTDVIEELVARGSDVDSRDRAGLPLTSVARLLKNRHGRSRDSVLRLVDSHYPHEKALANFTRLTKKIYSVQSLLKLP